MSDANTRPDSERGFASHRRALRRHKEEAVPFQITPLPGRLYEPLFQLDDEELRARSARRVLASSKPGYPCRVSLAEAEIGETLILVNHETVPFGPYRATHAIYVRENARPAVLEPDELPDVLRTRTYSVRTFDSDWSMRCGAIVPADSLRDHLTGQFEDRETAIIHIHNAGAGCFAAAAIRA